jgi:hypothetical protein
MLTGKFDPVHFVCIVRDPASVAASWQARADNPADHWPARNDAQTSIEAWNRHVGLALEFHDENPDKITFVIYEDLFNADATALSRLLARLGLASDGAISEAYRKITAEAAALVDGRTRLSGEQADLVSSRADLALYERARTLAMASVH